MELRSLPPRSKHQVSGIKLSALLSLTSSAELVQEHDNDPILEGTSSTYSSDHISPESTFLQGTGKHRKKRKASLSGFDEAQRLGGERHGSASLDSTKTEEGSILPGGNSSLDGLTTSVDVEVSVTPGSGERSTKHLSIKPKATKGRRKGKTAGSQGIVHTENLHIQENLENAGSDIMEGIESHGEDEEMEDLATRTEEECEIITRFWICSLRTLVLMT